MKNFLLFFFIVPLLSNAQVIVTAVGTGTGGYNGDNIPATMAELHDPFGIALDDSSNLYIADFENNRLRKVSPAYGGVITTVAGSLGSGNLGDNGPAHLAHFGGIFDVAVDHNRNLYIADAGGHRIRKINSGDTITTIAGTGVGGYNGDNIPATDAQLNGPKSVTIDAKGNIYILDAYNYRIRKIDTMGMITTIAGTGVDGYSPDGSSGDTCRFQFLFCLRADKFGNLFFFDSLRVRKLDTAGIITTIAGNGVNGFSGDGGMATAAMISRGGGLGWTVWEMFLLPMQKMIEYGK